MADRELKPARCTSCKRRHVKCGEETPTCLRCQIAGLRCEYATPGAGSAIGADKTAAVKSSTTTNEESTALTRANPRDVIGLNLPWGVITGARGRKGGLTPAESLFLENFQLRMAENLSRCGLAEFWYRTILREADFDDCVFHCIAGIGALGRVFENKRGTPTNGLFTGLPMAPKGSVVLSDLAPAIKQYSKALSSFRARLSSPISRVPCRTIMIVSILLIVYEMLQGNAAAVDRLLSNALQTLKSKMAAARIVDLHVLLARSPLDDDGVVDAIYLIPRLAAMRCAVAPSGHDFSWEWLVKLGTHPKSIEASFPPKNPAVESIE